MSISEETREMQTSNINPSNDENEKYKIFSPGKITITTLSINNPNLCQIEPINYLEKNEVNYLDNNEEDMNESKNYLEMINKNISENISEEENDEKELNENNNDLIQNGNENIYEEEKGENNKFDNEDNINNELEMLKTENKFNSNYINIGDEEENEKDMDNNELNNCINNKNLENNLENEKFPDNNIEEDENNIDNEVNEYNKNYLIDDNYDEEEEEEEFYEKYSLPLSMNLDNNNLKKEENNNLNNNNDNSNNNINNQIELNKNKLNKINESELIKIKVNKNNNLINLEKKDIKKETNVDYKEIDRNNYKKNNKEIEGLNENNKNNVIDENFNYNYVSEISENEKEDNFKNNNNKRINDFSEKNNYDENEFDILQKFNNYYKFNINKGNNLQNNRNDILKKNELTKNDHSKINIITSEIINNTPEKNNINNLYSTDEKLANSPIVNKNFYKNKFLENFNNNLNVIKSSELLLESKDKFDMVKIPEGRKSGFGEPGNHLESSNFDEKNNDMKLIAFVVQKNDRNNNKTNYLVDTKGNFLKKSEIDDYIAKNDDSYSIINDFKLKMLENRYKNYPYEENKMREKNIRDKNMEEKNISKNINSLINRNNIEIRDLSREHSVNNFYERKKSNNLINSIEKENLLLNNSKGNPVVDNSQNNINKLSLSTKFKNGTIKSDLTELMSIWRQRYGEKKLINQRFNDLASNSYSNSSLKDIMVERTNSILKKASKKHKENINIPNTKCYSKNEKNYKKYYPKIELNKNSNISNYFITKKNKNPILKEYTSSYGNNENENNHLLKNKNIFINNNNDNNNNKKIFKKNILNKDELKENKIYESFNNKNNNNKINGKNLLNIKFNYNNNKFKSNKVMESLIKKNLYNYNKENKEINLKNNNIMTYNDIKSNSIINDYIYNNITKINERNKRRKSSNNKYSVLSNQANKLIKYFNNGQKKNGKIQHNNILKSKSFIGEANKGKKVTRNNNIIPIINKTIFYSNLSNNSIEYNENQNKLVKNRKKFQNCKSLSFSNLK